VIEPRQEVTVSFSVTPRAVGPGAVLAMPCCVRGMDSALCLRITADVRDLAVAYSVSGDRRAWLSGDGVIVDFGGNNRLDDVPTLYLRIENQSAIATQFRLAIDAFPSAVAAATSVHTGARAHTHTHTHTRLTALLPRLPG